MRCNEPRHPFGASDLRMTSTFTTARRARACLRVPASQENPYEGAENPEDGFSKSMDMVLQCYTC